MKLNPSNVVPSLLLVLFISLIISKDYIHAKIVNDAYKIGINLVSDNTESNISELLQSCSFIAHAGGEINGAKYTNSKEAVLNSISKGYKLIELDLRTSSDNIIVAAHDWESFINNTEINERPDHEQFKKQKYLSQFTTIDISDINDIFNNNKGLVLVTDKIRDIQLLSENVSYKDRVIVEVFDIYGYNQAIEYGFNNVAFNIDIDKSEDIDFIISNNIKAVTYRGDHLESDRQNMVNAQKLASHGVYSLIYSYEDLDIDKIRGPLGISNSLIYVDFIEDGTCY